MITILVCAIIGILINWAGVSDFMEFIGATITGTVIGGAIGFAIAIILPMNTKLIHYSIPIECLQDGTGVKGGFFIGVTGDMNYAYYTREKSGMFKLNMVNYQHAQIRYSDNTPSIDVSEVYAPDEGINYWAYDWDLWDKTYIFNVPKGSIQNSFNLDAR